MIKHPVTAAALLLAGFIGLTPPAYAASPDTDPLSENSILHDPQVPVFGNAKGDITIVEYFDYRCPYCKKVNPDLLKIVQEDGHVRLVFKDWPVFGGVSIYAAKLALATKYQNKLFQAHDALISAKDKLSEDTVDGLLAGAGVDVQRAKQDLAAHKAEIETILARNDAQAQAFGFQGTPAFIIGHFRVPGALDSATFKRAIAEARAAAKKAKPQAPSTH